MLYIANFKTETLNKGSITEVKVSLKELYVGVKLAHLLRQMLTVQR